MDLEKRRWDARKIASEMEKMNQEWTFQSNHNVSKGRSGPEKLLSLDDSLTSHSSMEMESPSLSVAMSRSCGCSHLKEICDALTTAKELVNIVSHVLGQSNPPSSSAMSLISAIGAEIDKACLQVNDLTAQEQIVEAKWDNKQGYWKKKEQQGVEAAMVCIASELEAERKSRRKSEIANQKLREEMEKLRSELELERRARRVMEEEEQKNHVEPKNQHGVKSSAFLKLKRQLEAFVGARRDSNKQAEGADSVEQCRQSGESDLFSVQLNTHRKDTALCQWRGAPIFVSDPIGESWHGDFDRERHDEAERRSDCLERNRGKSALLVSRSFPAPSCSSPIHNKQHQAERCSRCKLRVLNACDQE